MAQSNPFIVGRQSEVKLFDDLVAGRTAYHLLNIYGPGGIGKTVVGQKLAAHAGQQGIPLASVDGIRSDLTPDRILGLFAEGLAATPAGGPLTDSLRQFDREFHDYLIVNQVLQQGGGIGALFDVVGNVKDPAGLASIIGGLGSGIAEGVKRTVSNRFALERYLRGAERVLTASFMDGLQAGLAELRRPVALLFDTYEEMEGLDDWVCRTLTPGLPDDVRVVILGRNELHRINFDWSDLEETVHTLPLPELDEIDAKAYLRHFGLKDAAALDQVYRFTGGYPLLLVLVRHLAKEAGGWEHVGALEGSGDRDYVASELLRRILREEKAAEVQAFLEKGVIARWFNPEIVAVILEVDAGDARAIYEKLRRHSFVERHPYGLKFHDKIREILVERLKTTSQGEYDRLNKRLMAYYAEKAGIVKPAPIESEGPAKDATPGAKYIVNIYGPAQGLTIGDEAQIQQTFNDAPGTLADERS